MKGQQLLICAIILIIPIIEILVDDIKKIIFLSIVELAYVVLLILLMRLNNQMNDK